MKRRSFLAGLLAAPLAKFLPVPEGIPVAHTEDLKVTEAQVDFGGMDQTSIWLVSWSPPRDVVPEFYLYGVPVFTNRNWLKKELNR